MQVLLFNAYFAQHALDKKGILYPERGRAVRGKAPCVNGLVIRASTEKALRRRELFCASTKPKNKRAERKRTLARREGRNGAEGEAKTKRKHRLYLDHKPPCGAKGEA